MYLTPRANGWVFQRRVPHHLVAILGVSIIRMRLGPMQKRGAQRLANILAGYWERRFVALMEKADDDEVSLESLLDEAEKLLEGFMTPAHEMQVQAALSTVRADLARATADRAANVALLDTVRNLSVGVARAATMPVTPPVVATGGRGKFTAGMMLSDAFPAAIESRVKSLREVDGTETHYCGHVRTVAKVWLGLIGDREIGQYTALDVSDYVSALAKLPSNINKRRDFKGLTYSQAIEKNSKLKPPHPTLSKKAIKNYISEFGTLWRLITAGIPEVGDITVARARIPRTAKKSIDREGLPPASLNIWLASAVKVRESALYWLPLVALLTGMRQAELVYLQPGDICDYAGRTVIDIRRPLIIRGKEVERKLKTEDTSPRVVALNKFLFDCGFVDWARSRETDWLFPSFHRRAEDPADAAQKRLNLWMRRLGIHVPYKQTFHSLRHNCKAWLRPKVGDRTVDVHAGHVPEGVGANYGFKSLTPEEVDIVAAVALPEGVDFSLYLINKPPGDARARRIKLR